MRHENSKIMNSVLKPDGYPLSCRKIRAATFIHALALVLAGLAAFLLPALGSAQSSDIQIWQKIIQQTPPVQPGCFQASYPDTQWEQVFCAQPQDAIPPWQPPSDAQAILPASGYSASAAGGPIWAAEGSFLNVTGVTSIMDSLANPSGNAYSLQINTGYFEIPGGSSVCGNSAGCTGWVQFAYQNFPKENRGYLSLWYWVGGDHSCRASWTASGGWCYSYHGMNTSLQPVSSFNDQINLSGKTVDGVDSVTVTMGEQAYSATNQSGIHELPQLWQQAQFNVFGLGNSSGVSFNSGSALTINTRIDNGTANPPNCSTGAGTNEPGNLHYNSPCCRYAGGKPSIAFAEGTEDNPDKFTCAALGSNTITPEVTPTGGGTIAPSVALQVPNQAVSTFVVTPGANYAIGSVTGCNGSLNGNIFTTAPATGSCTVRATFVSSTVRTYTVTASASPNGAGTISPAGTLAVSSGTAQAFTLTPSSGYVASSVGGTCKKGTLNGNTYTTQAITANCTVTATFTRGAYTVTPSVSGAGGAISPASPVSVKGAATASFTLKPSPGYEVSSVDGTCGGARTGNVFKTNAITGNCTVAAQFSLGTYTVTPSVSGVGGAISPATATSVQGTSTTSFTLTPDTGYIQSSVGGTCGGTLRGNTYTTKAIAGNCAVTASFASTAPSMPSLLSQIIGMLTGATLQRPAEWATPIDSSFNLYRITPQLYRSAQPEQSNVPQLQALGIRTIISLRAFHRDEDIFTMPGVKLVRIPMYAWWISDDQIVSAMLAIENALKDGPVLIHCQHGADRTGVVSAMYRILNQGWTRGQALYELEQGNFGFHGIWIDIPLYIKYVDIQRVRQRIAAARPRAAGRSNTILTWWPGRGMLPIPYGRPSPLLFT